MSDGGRLLWIVGVFAAATVGVLAGIWIGGEIEAGVYEEILTKANLPAECWERITAGAESLVRELEGEDKPTPAPVE
ncbi:MAG: hypothetical protein QNJ62_05610 [Methyloceanibacter sp.]|nr:hypothetical protein [Methyloceanibacter sp.]